MPGAISVTTSPSGPEPDHAALGDIGHVLPLHPRPAAREADLIDLGHELGNLALLVDDQSPVFHDRIFAPALKLPEKTILRARAVMSTKPPAPAVRCGVADRRETLTDPSASISRNDSSEQSKPPA